MQLLEHPAGLAALAAAVFVCLAALRALTQTPREESALGLSASALCLLLLSLPLPTGVTGVDLQLIAWIIWPVTAWWAAAAFGRRPERGRAARWAIVLVAIGFAIVMARRFGIPFEVRSAVDGGGWGRWAALVGVGFWIAAAANLLFTMRGAVGKPHLRKAAAIGALTSLAPLWPETVAVASGALPVASLWLAMAGGFVGHWSLAWWLLRYRRREGTVQFGRPVAYVSLAVLLLGFYLLIVGGVGKVVAWIGGDIRVFLSAAGGVLLAVLGLVLASSGRLWDRLRNLLDRSLYRGDFDFRSEWRQISEELASLPDPRDLGATLTELLSDRLRSPTVYLYRRTDENYLELWARTRAGEAPPEPLSVSSLWTDWLWRLGAPSEWSAIEGGDKPGQLERTTRLVVPLVAKQQLVAIACLGGREEPYTAEERLWLEAAGQQAALAVLAANLTERLIETRELASFHRLSSFVIHDVKNAVSMISLLLQNLNESGASLDAATVRSTLEQAETKLNGLIERFSAARDTFKLAVRPIDVEALLREQCARAARSFPRVRFELELKETTVHADPEQISRVVENLLINACEAMSGDGRIAITCRREDDGAAIHVQDSGPGMSVDFIRERLFRPFATTKKKGLGIGLYQSREIMRAHGGRLTAESAPGEGSTFSMWLPEAGRAGVDAEP